MRQIRNVGKGRRSVRANHRGEFVCNFCLGFWGAGEVEDEIVEGHRRSFRASFD